MDDPKARKTVFELVGNACNERIYPVGQMERGSTGVLLFTNDADTAKKLTKGVNGAANIYHIVLDKPLSKQQLDTIAAGTVLEDGTGSGGGNQLYRREEQARIRHAYSRKQASNSSPSVCSLRFRGGEIGPRILRRSN
jgi:23S rRNA pseudouridine2605 synthase